MFKKTGMFYESFGIESPRRMQPSVTSTCSMIFEGKKISLRRLKGPCRQKKGNVSCVTAEGQCPILGSDLGILFTVPLRDAWLVLVGEHVGLEMNCPPGLSLPSHTYGSTNAF